VYGWVRETKVERSAGLRSLLVCAVGLVVLGGCAFIDKINKLTVEDVTVRQVKDGTYEGSQDFSPVTACEVSQFFSGPKAPKGVIMPRTRGPR